MASAVHLAICPRYSCCHRPRAGALRTLLHYLARLRLAAGTDELLPNQRGACEARQAHLWEQFQHAAHRRLCVPTARLERLAEPLMAALLTRACCRGALRRAAPLNEALGPGALLAWGEEEHTTRAS